MASDKRGSQVIAFLDRHRLEHTPGHYAFAYRYLFSTDTSFRSKVAAIVDGGVRITPDQVAELAPGSAVAADNATLMPRLERITTRILDIIAAATQEAGTFGRDLAIAAAELLGAESRNVHTIVAGMIARAERAEAGLSEMTRQTAILRNDLDQLASVTGVDNGNHLLNRLAVEARLSVALGAPQASVVIVLVVIDGFAGIIEKHGAGVGERVMRALGETLRDHCAPHRIGRWSDEMLVVPVERASADDVNRQVKAAKTAFGRRSLTLREDDQPLGKVTFSAVISEPRARDVATAVAAATAALAQARVNGGNVVTRDRV